MEPWYKCERPTCNAGFILTSVTEGSYKCVDINECLAEDACIGDHVTCNNIEGMLTQCTNNTITCDFCWRHGFLSFVGSYQCLCDPFYHMVGRYCVDINECIESPPCSSRQICTNTEPGYTCTCLYGYTGENCDTPSSDGKMCYFKNLYMTCNGT